MKRNTYLLHGMFGAVPALALLCGCASTQVETSSLKDELLSIREQAQAAGATKVHYEASVVTTANGNVALVVPIMTSPAIGLGAKREIGSKVAVDIDMKQQKNSALKLGPTPSGRRYLLNLKTLKATELE